MRVSPASMLDLIAVLELRHPIRIEHCKGAYRVATDMPGREVAEHELRNLALRELLRHSLLAPRIGSDAVAPPLTDREIHE